AGEKSLDESASELERLLVGVSDANLVSSISARLSFTSLYDSLIKLAIARSDANAAFMYAERARLVSLRLRNIINNDLRADAPPSMSNVQSRLGAGDLLLSYVVMGPDIISWSIRRDASTMTVLRGAAYDARTMSIQLRTAIDDGD